MAGKVLDIQVCNPLKQRKGLTESATQSATTHTSARYGQFDMKNQLLYYSFALYFTHVVNRLQHPLAKQKAMKTHPLQNQQSLKNLNNQKRMTLKRRKSKSKNFL